MSVRYSAEVFGYVEPSLKDRMRRLKKADRGLSESFLINECLANGLKKFEEEVGIFRPDQGPRSKARRGRRRIAA